MTLEIITLQTLLSYLGKADTQKILQQFKSRPHCITGEVNDVESFLHKKAIYFEEMTTTPCFLPYI